MKIFISFCLQIILFTLQANAQINKVEIVATGLTCSMCSNAINKQLLSLPDVNKVDIDLNKNQFTVTLKANNNYTPKTFKDKIEDAGFFVGSMIISMQVASQTVVDNTQIGSYIYIDTKPTNVNGSTKAKVLNKGYVTQAQYKKLVAMYKKFPTYAKKNEGIFYIKNI